MPQPKFHEFLRFVLAGLLSTLSNLAAAGFARQWMAFEFALIFGIFAGLTSSFLLSKFFAFRSSQWSNAPSELMRFLIVYAVSVSLYWIVAVLLKNIIYATFKSSELADITGLLTGCGAMMIVSYFGHRVFTYRARDVQH